MEWPPAGTAGEGGELAGAGPHQSVSRTVCVFIKPSPRWLSIFSGNWSPNNVAAEGRADNERGAACVQGLAPTNAASISLIIFWRTGGGWPSRLRARRVEEVKTNSNFQRAVHFKIAFQALRSNSSIQLCVAVYAGWQLWPESARLDAAAPRC